MRQTFSLMVGISKLLASNAAKAGPLTESLSPNFLWSSDERARRQVQVRVLVGIYRQPSECCHNHKRGGEESLGQDRENERRKREKVVKPGREGRGAKRKARCLTLDQGQPKASALLLVFLGHDWGARAGPTRGSCAMVHPDRLMEQLGAAQSEHFWLAVPGVSSRQWTRFDRGRLRNTNGGRS
jgi:hypothetical protein